MAFRPATDLRSITCVICHHTISTEGVIPDTVDRLARDHCRTCRITNRHEYEEYINDYAINMLCNSMMDALNNGHFDLVAQVIADMGQHGS